jgi:hypothetical protein
MITDGSQLDNLRHGAGLPLHSPIERGCTETDSRQIAKLMS